MQCKSWQTCWNCVYCKRTISTLLYGKRGISV